MKYDNNLVNLVLLFSVQFVKLCHSRIKQLLYILFIVVIVLNLLLNSYAHSVGYIYCLCYF